MKCWATHCKQLSETKFYTGGLTSLSFKWNLLYLFFDHQITLRDDLINEGCKCHREGHAI